MTTRFSHVAINVSELERSVAFYEAVTTLRRVAAASAPEQAFESLGIARGRFDSAVLRDPSSELSPAVQLLQWTDPRSHGRAYASFVNSGLFRICFQHPDAAEHYDTAVAAGARPFTPPLMPEGQNVTGRPVFCMPDPDGVVIQHVTLPGRHRLYHTAYHTRDADAVVDLAETLGLALRMRAETTVPVRNAFGPPDAPGTFKAALLSVADDTLVDGHPSFSLDVCQWTEPQPHGEAYPDQLHNGIVRLGFAVDDLVGMHGRLAKAGYACSAIESREFGGAIGVRQLCTVAAPDGVVIELLDRRL